jgi:hypothetical protein
MINKKVNFGLICYDSYAASNFNVKNDSTSDQ